MKRVYLLMAVAVLCLGAETTFAQPSGDVVWSLAVLENNTHINKTIDFGFIFFQHTTCEGVIGDLVWEDRDEDGIQDGKEVEPGIKGAIVYLLDADGNSIPGIESVTTDDSGLYKFEGLCAGNYIVRVVPPSANYKSTLPNQGNDDSIDSDGLNTTIPSG